MPSNSLLLGSRRRGVGGRPDQGEALVVWGLWAAAALAVLVTYSRLAPAELYHVSGEGLRGGASRALVLANFPLSLVAIALVLVAVAALPRAWWWLAGPAICLCTVTAWPGVVDQGDLDARWVNAVPALGVALALALTVVALRRTGRGFAPRLPGDPLRLLLAGLVLVASLPWFSAEIGFHLPGDVFLGEEVPAGETLAAVHLGHHHGTDGALLVLSGLLLSRVRRAGRPGAVVRAYLALMLAYGAVNATQDFWLEQLVKRGWLEWRIPNALEPGPEPVWLVIVGVALCVGAMLRIEGRATSSTSPARP